MARVWQELAKTLTPTGVVNAFGAQMITEVPNRPLSPIKFSDVVSNHCTADLTIASLEKAMSLFEQAKKERERHRCLFVGKNCTGAVAYTNCMKVKVVEDMDPNGWYLGYYYENDYDNKELYQP